MGGGACLLSLVSNVAHGTLIKVIDFGKHVCTNFFILQYPTGDSLISAAIEGNDVVLIWVITFWQQLINKIIRNPFPCYGFTGVLPRSSSWRTVYLLGIPLMLDLRRQWVRRAAGNRGVALFQRILRK